ncbi:hypothetical protein GV827_17480 [Sulfitobacter sp. JBTF-M27]|uniref:Capsule synthesis protein CapA domain-containing protein n=1 Tax=Sulfitobacter sediminilitoris TaxID=2698830 RepID=A0A6P0CFL7_9RHOB|nr:CapA family protein [Sulfitobacter sediminilitoris]NEK24180.1 hypothetical protein [Sulfitobacter sediminilitoris]
MNSNSEYSSSTYCITFLGDTNPGETYQLRNEQLGRENILKSRGYDYGYGQFSSFLKSSDFTIANLEAAVTSIRQSELEGIKPYLDWTDPVKTPAALKRARIDAVSLANNHVCDFGERGVDETISALKNLGILYFGAGLNEQDAGKPLHHFFDLNSKKHHVIVATGFEHRQNHVRWKYYADKSSGGVNRWSRNKAFEEIHYLRESFPSAFIIAFPHWGSNYCYVSERQERLGRLLIDAGADLVIGHGSHMMQEIERYRERFIVYSIGNFVFNSPGRFRKFKVAPIGLIVRLLLFDNGENLGFKLCLYPILSDNRATNYNVRPVDERNLRALIRSFRSPNEDKEWLLQSGKLSKDIFGFHLSLSDMGKGNRQS